MRLNQFRDVVAIAERGSLRAAARYLRVTQPALTRSIRELERELGVPLFERRARGMVPTPMGSAVVRRAAAVLSEVRRVREEVDQLHGGTGGRVVAGLSFVGHTALLPKALRPFHARYPNVQLHIIDGGYPPMEAGLKDGSIDFYVGPRPEGPPPPELVLEKLFDGVRVVIGRKGHPLAAARSLRDLVGAEWASSSITFKAEEEFRELFAQHGLPAPRLALRGQGAFTLVTALANSDLLAMLPIQFLTAAEGDTRLARIIVKEPLPAPAIVVVRRGDLPLTPAAEFLLDLLRRNIPPSAKRRQA